MTQHRHRKGVRADWNRKACSARTMRSLRKRRSEAGVCRECGTGQLKSKTLCFKCLLRLISYNNLGTGTRWRELVNIFNGKCHYTGRPIYIGETASVDHMLPLCRWPWLKNEIRNLAWAASSVNTAKGDSTPREFFTTCATVLAYGIEQGTLWADAGIAPCKKKRLLIELKKLISELEAGYNGLRTAD